MEKKLEQALQEEILTLQRAELKKLQEQINKTREAIAESEMIIRDIKQKKIWPQG